MHDTTCVLTTLCIIIIVFSVCSVNNCCTCSKLFSATLLFPGSCSKATHESMECANAGSSGSISSDNALSSCFRIFAGRWPGHPIGCRRQNWQTDNNKRIQPSSTFSNQSDAIDLLVEIPYIARESAVSNKGADNTRVPIVSVGLHSPVVAQ